AAIDWRTLAFTALLGVSAALASALLPALRIARGDLEPSLRHTAASIASGGLRQPLRRGLVIGELAIAVVLLTVAGLLVRSTMRLKALDLGFNPSELLAVKVAPPSDRMTAAERKTLVDRGLHAIAQLPGVLAASGVSQHPLQGPIGSDSPY